MISEEEFKDAMKEFNAYQLRRTFNRNHEEERDFNEWFENHFVPTFTDKLKSEYNIEFED